MAHASYLLLRLRNEALALDAAMLSTPMAVTQASVSILRKLHLPVTTFAVAVASRIIRDTLV